MPPVDIHFPAMLHPIVGGKRLRVDAPTLAEALEAAFRAVPALRFALCDESGALRMHVLCFLNDTNARELKSLHVPVKDGDQITIVQAISGG